MRGPVRLLVLSDNVRTSGTIEPEANVSFVRKFMVFVRDPFACTPNRQAAAREEDNTAKNGHRTEAENLHRGRGDDSGRLLMAEHVEDVRECQSEGADIAGGGRYQGAERCQTEQHQALGRREADTKAAHNAGER